MMSLAKEVARDGEGATKFVTIIVKSAKNHADARTVARTIATSPLVKTALFGEDANWGRIVCAAGYAGVPFPADRISLSISSPTAKHGPLQLLKEGQPTMIDEAISTRSVLQAAFLVRQGLKLKVAATACWANAYDAKGGAESDRGMVLQTINSLLP